MITQTLVMQDVLRWIVPASTMLLCLYILLMACRLMIKLRQHKDSWICGNAEYTRACSWVEGCATISLMFLLVHLDLFRQIYVSDPDTYTIFFWGWQAVDIGIFLLIRRALLFIHRVISNNCPYTKDA